MPNKNQKQVSSFGHDQLVRILNASEDHKISRLGALKALGLPKTRATLGRLSQVINDLEAEERLKKIGGHSVCLVSPPSRSTPTKFQSDFLEVLEQAETQQLSRVGALKAMGLQRTRDNLDRLAEAIDALHLEGSVQKLRGHSVCLSGDSKKRKLAEEGQGGRLLILNPNTPMKEIAVQPGGTLSLKGSEQWKVQQADSQKLVLVQKAKVDQEGARRQAQAAKRRKVQEARDGIQGLKKEHMEDFYRFGEVSSAGGDPSEYPEEKFQQDSAAKAKSIKKFNRELKQLDSEPYRFPISVETKVVELSSNVAVRSDAISDFPVLYIGSSSAFESIPSEPARITKETKETNFTLSTSEKDYIYVLGGRDKSSESIILSQAQRYDIDAKIWETIADMNYPRQKLSAVMYNGQLYAVGGKNTVYDYSDLNQAFNYVERYNEAQNKWEEMPPLNVSRYQCHLCVYNGSMYAIGGYEGLFDHRIKTVERYDAKQNKWSFVAEPPEGCDCAFVFKGSMYIVNGEEVLQYDHVNDKWLQPSGEEQYLTTLADDQKIVVFGDDLYAVGGAANSHFTRDPNSPKQLYHFEPEDLSKLSQEEKDRIGWKHHWKQLKDMQNARSLPQAFVLNGFLYAVGNDGKNQTIEKYDRHGNNWEIVAEFADEIKDLEKFAAVGTDEFKKRSVIEDLDEI